MKLVAITTDCWIDPDTVQSVGVVGDLVRVVCSNGVEIEIPGLQALSLAKDIVRIINHHYEPDEPTQRQALS